MTVLSSAQEPRTGRTRLPNNKSKGNLQFQLRFESPCELPGNERLGGGGFFFRRVQSGVAVFGNLVLKHANALTPTLSKDLIFGAAGKAKTPTRTPKKGRFPP